MSVLTVQLERTRRLLQLIGEREPVGQMLAGPDKIANSTLARMLRDAKARHLVTRERRQYRLTPAGITALVNIEVLQFSLTPRDGPQPDPPERPKDPPMLS